MTSPNDRPPIGYDAPWGTPLKIISMLTTLLCLGLSIYMIARGQMGPRWTAALPLAIVVGGSLFTIRGYALTPDAMRVRRLFWSTTVPLAGLQSAEIVPDAMRGSLRLCGNAGLFSFSGYYRNKSLRTYRAFVTDLHRTVVLRFASRTIVVSPADAESFAREAMAGRSC
jgi:hypothetical protein